MPKLIFRLGAMAAAALVLAAAPPAPIAIDYPENGSVFPPEITAPTFLWRDPAAGARLWRIEVTFGDGLPGIQAVYREESGCASAKSTRAAFRTTMNFPS